MLFQQNHCGRSEVDIRTNSFWITEVMPRSGAEVLLNFNLPHAISPFESGTGDDTRNLSVGILSMEIQAVK